MTTIERVLATVAYDGEHRRRLESIFHAAEVVFVDPRDHASIETELDRVDVAVLRGDASPSMLGRPRLRWVHCDHAGLDRCATPELISGLAITSSAGRSAGALAEHAIMFLLALSYELPRFQRAQRLRVWGVPDQGRLRGLGGRTVVVVGTGHTGSALGHRLRALGARVVGYRRRDAPASGFDEVYSAAAGRRLVDVLDGADAVVLAASLNDASRAIVGRPELQALRRGGLVVNMGRGLLLDEGALVDELRSGHLGGAGLDVTAVEPLPLRSPLWRAPRLLLTPHTTPPIDDRTSNSLDIIEDNVRRYRDGESLVNQLGADDVFSDGYPARSSRSDRPARLVRRVARRLV